MKWASNNRRLAIAVAAVLLAALLISWRVSVWQRQVRLNHALIRAVNKDDTPAVERLLDEGADPNTRDGYRAPASWPVRVWDKLRHRTPADPVVGYPVLLTAVDNGNVALVKALVAHKANVNAIGDEDIDPQFVTTALWEDEAEGDHTTTAQAAIAKTLITAGANPNLPGHRKTAPLFNAVHNPENAEILINAGANVNCRDDLDETPIVYLVAYQEASDGEQGDTIAVYQKLLAAGADINARDDAGYTALMNASYGGLTRVVKFLLAHGARTEFRGTNNGEDALQLAKDQGNKAVVAMLVQATKQQNTHAGTFGKGAGKR